MTSAWYLPCQILVRFSLHIITYFLSQDNDDVVMVLDYAGGGDLYGLLKRAGGRLPEEQALDLVLRPFLAAMEYLHGKGIVHR